MKQMTDEHREKIGCCRDNVEDRDGHERPGMTTEEYVGSLRERYGKAVSESSGRSGRQEVAMKPAKWLVHTKGGPNEPCFEIAVVREDNQHGLASYGWFDDNKLLVSHDGGPCRWPVTVRIWTALVKTAGRVAAEMNREENSQ